MRLGAGSTEGRRPAGILSGDDPFVHHAAATIGASVALNNVPAFANLVLTIVGVNQLVTVEPHPAAVPAKAARRVVRPRPCGSAPKESTPAR